VDETAGKAQNATNSGPNWMLKTDSEISDSLVTCQTSQGAGVHASLLHLTRYLAVFEIYNPDLALRTSEVLEEFRIVLDGRAVYSGRAVVGNLVNTGLILVCQVTLNEQSWTDVDIESFLARLRLWLDQVELSIRASPAADRVKLEQEIAEALRDSVVPPANSLFDRFEEVSDRVEEQLRPGAGGRGIPGGTPVG
jgi:extracellular factor (EF) 3-hydroxypalmitic acid methyl ester biosynthesis protein